MPFYGAGCYKDCQSYWSKYIYIYSELWRPASGAPEMNPQRVQQVEKSIPHARQFRSPRYTLCRICFKSPCVPTPTMQMARSEMIREIRDDPQQEPPKKNTSFDPRTALSPEKSIPLPGRRPRLGGGCGSLRRSATSFSHLRGSDVHVEQRAWRTRT